MIQNRLTLDSIYIFLKQKSALSIIAIVHQMPNYFVDTRTLFKTFNVLPLPSSLVYFNSILYGYEIFNNSVPEFVSNLLIDIFKLNPRNHNEISLTV